MEFLVVLLLGALAIGATVSTHFVSKNSNDIRIYRTRERTQGEKAFLFVAMWVAPLVALSAMALTQRALPAIIAVVIGVLFSAFFPYFLPKDPGPGLPVGRQALHTSAWIGVGFAVAALVAGGALHVWIL